MIHDVIIIGGSYAGMAAALQLLRARRTVLIIDAGQRRNRFASASHGFLTQDGVDPAVIAEAAKRQLISYPTLTWVDDLVTEARQAENGFTVRTQAGDTCHARRLLFAVGVSDTLPAVEGLAERWGKSVFHCPYCHGYELNQGRIGVIATSAISLHQAQIVNEWGETTLLLNNAWQPTEDEREQLMARGIHIETRPIKLIENQADVRLGDDEVLSFAGLFTASRNAPATPVAEALGCAVETTPFGTQIFTDEGKQTSLPGVFACGDVARVPHTVSLAVGDGAYAGAMVHRSLVF